jgi:hypothetical protein
LGFSLKNLAKYIQLIRVVKATAKIFKAAGAWFQLEALGGRAPGAVKGWPSPRRVCAIP